MPVVPKLTNYYCWHLVTIVLFVMTAGFAYAAWVPAGQDVAVMSTILAIAFTLWSLALIIWKHRHPLQLPQWVLFLAISAAALAGLA